MSRTVTTSTTSARDGGKNRRASERSMPSSTWLFALLNNTMLR